MNVIFGAGGFAREVGWLFDEFYSAANYGSRIDAFVASDGSSNLGANIHGAPIISESNFFSRYASETLNIFFAVASPRLRQELHHKCLTLNSANFPTLVHPSALMDRRQNSVHLGLGVIICAGTIITTDVEIGDFAQLNLNCTVGHDTKIGAFSTLSPGVHVSGRVELGRGTFIGTGAVILENLHVHDDAVIGAGATVVSTIAAPGTYIGTPARLRQ